MKNKFYILLGFIGLFVFFLSGCSHRIGDCTAISTKNIYCENVDVTKLPKKEGVEAEDVRFLGIGANVENALDRALEAGGGNLMINAVVYYEDRVFSSGYRIRGTVVKVPYRSNQSSQIGQDKLKASTIKP